MTKRRSAPMSLLPSALRRFFFACIVLLPLFGAECDAQEPVRIGINYPLTGPYSVEGLDQIRAARLAVDQINEAGGILGRPVELIARDSGSSVLLTTININELIQAGCSMVFGGASSDVAIAAGEICQRRGALFFGTLTYSTATTLENAHRLNFRESCNSWMAARALAGWLNTEFKGKKYFYITADYTWGWTTEASMREVTNTTDISRHPRVLTSLGASDYRYALNKARLYKPNVLVLSLFGKDLANALRQAKAMGVDFDCQLVVPNLTLGMAERSGPSNIEGVVGVLPWTWKVPFLLDNERGKAFVDEFVRRYRRYPSTSGASAYSIPFIYKNAVERAGSFENDKAARALEGHSYSLLKGRQTWRALDHQNVQDVYLVRVNSRGKVLADPLRLDYFEILGSFPGEEAVRSPGEWRRLRRERGLPDHLEPLAEDANHEDDR
ncbi:MAG: ABC transporter substrate-binding protein [Desulfovibrionaceae bacterium]